MATIDIKSIFNAMRIKILGEDNVHLIHLIDKFYSYKDRKRRKVLFYSSLIITGVLGSIIFLFFRTNYTLQQDLNTAIASQTFLEIQGRQYTQLDNQYVSILSELARTNKSLDLVTLVKEQIESLAVEQFQVSNKALKEPLPPTHSLVDDFSKEYVQVSLTNISLKEALNFVEEIEKLPYKLKVENFSIKPWDKEKLYFDVTLKILAYVPTRGSDATTP